LAISASISTVDKSLVATTVGFWSDYTSGSTLVWDLSWEITSSASTAVCGISWSSDGKAITSWDWLASESIHVLIVNSILIINTIIEPVLWVCGDFNSSTWDA
jgi:hypothetical protein